MQWPVEERAPYGLASNMELERCGSLLIVACDPLGLPTVTRGGDALTSNMESRVVTCPISAALCSLDALLGLTTCAGKQYHYHTICRHTVLYYSTTSFRTQKVFRSTPCMQFVTSEQCSAVWYSTVQYTQAHLRRMLNRRSRVGMEDALRMWPIAFPQSATIRLSVPLALSLTVPSSFQVAPVRRCCPSPSLSRPRYESPQNGSATATVPTLSGFFRLTALNFLLLVPEPLSLSDIPCLLPDPFAHQ